MKLTIDRKQLVDVLGRVQGAVQSRTTLPILSGVLIRTKDTTAEFTTTDLDSAMRASTPASVASPGETVLPARRLYDIVRVLSDGDVTIAVSDKNVADIVCGPSKFKLMGMAADEFPPMPKDSKEAAIELHAGNLRDALGQVQHAVSTDETRYVLNGVYMEFGKESIAFVATDGRRLATVSMKADGMPTSVGIIIPARTVDHLLRLLGDEGAVRFWITESHMGFEMKNQAISGQPSAVSQNSEADSRKPIAESPSILISKQIEGAYPNYKQVIPLDGAITVAVSRDTLATVVRRVSLMTSDKSNSVKLSFAKNELVLTANTADVGESKESIPVKFDGKPFSIALNPKYLLDAIAGASSDDVTLVFKDELSPVVVRDAAHFLAVVMPMRMS